MRTLVVSDLHLGSRLEHDVLCRPEPLRRLIAALEGVDRLVLLGDVVELGAARRDREMRDAGAVLSALGRAVGAEREVIVVPGNHDHRLVERWARAQGGALAPDSVVPPDASRPLEQLVGWLAPARVRVHYPGVWLGERIWATHGHYLDRHLMPESAFGIGRGRLRARPLQRARPIDYELARRPSVTGLARFLPRRVAALIDDLAELARASTMPRVVPRVTPRVVPRRVLHRRYAPLLRRILGVQTRRASLPALARVVHRLGVDADWVLFGHVHRLGPLPEDRASLWEGPGGGPQLANSGSWVYEPLLLHRARPPHPYWPGGALLLEPGQDPRPLELLNDLPPAALAPEPHP